MMTYFASCQCAICVAHRGNFVSAWGWRWGGGGGTKVHMLVRVRLLQFACGLCRALRDTSRVVQLAATRVNTDNEERYVGQGLDPSFLEFHVHSTQRTSCHAQRAHLAL